MEKTGSFEYTMKVITHYQEEVLKSIEELGGNKYLVAIVESLGKA